MQIGKWMIAGFLLTFLIGYLEWGGGNAAFIYEVEMTLFGKANESLKSLIHPLIILPFLGQFFLLIALFQHKPKKRWVTIGIILQGVLMLMILLVGILSLNLKVMLSTVPFLGLAGYYFWTTRKQAVPT